MCHIWMIRKQNPTLKTTEVGASFTSATVSPSPVIKRLTALWDFGGLCGTRQDLKI